MKFIFQSKDELKAFIRLIQEIELELESEYRTENDIFRRFEISARVELLDEVLASVLRKQFNQQVKNSINFSKAVSIIIFQYREIVVDIYAELLKNRLVETIHKDMI